MAFSAAQLNRCLLVIGVAWAACSAEAQPAGRRPGQAIIFSSPDDEGASTNLPSLTAKPPALLDLANTVQSPGANMSVGAASQAAPEMAPPPPALSPALALQMRRAIDEQKNWAMMTPEQILNLPTQKKILGITDRDALGQPKDESVLAQFYARLDQSRARTNSDDSGLANLASRWDMAGSQDLQYNPDIWAPAGGKPETPALVNQFLNRTPGKRAASTPAAPSGWAKAFNLPGPPPKPTPEQQAAMDQFRQLLLPHSPPNDTAGATPLARPILSSAAVTPAIEAAVAPTLGNFYAPLNTGVGMPAGVAPLPRLFNQTNATTIYEPDWKPQAAPWASSAPQLGVIPQRKF